LQRDLFAQAVFYPQNWQYLGARTEIAAKLYDKRVFGKATFKHLEERPRPFVILNATDSTTGSRFEFNQDQFDLLCSDLSPVPIARGVTASSAFPGLLNSMAVDSHNKIDGKNKGCGYNGPGTNGELDWVGQALKDSHGRHRAIPQGAGTPRVPRSEPDDAPHAGWRSRRQHRSAFRDPVDRVDRSRRHGESRRHRNGRRLEPADHG
jgi:hypothetical protein